MATKSDFDEHERAARITSATNPVGRERLLAEWPVPSARAAADADGAGGFNGDGAELVSRREADVVEQDRATVAALRHR